jgi:hypothetical protein
MARMVRTLALAALVLVALPALASAQYREFTGRIDKVDANKLIVDNRKGDKVSFNRVDDTAVTLQEGAKVEGKRDAWEDLKKDDWVTVSWKFVDKPRKAYKVQVLAPRED